MRYRLAIFDFDGTLADSAGWFVGVLNDLARRHGFRQVDEVEIEALRRCGNREIIRRLAVPRWKLPLIAASLRARMAEEAAAIALFPGVEAALLALGGAGVVCAVVSSNAEANVRRILGPDAAAAVSHFACGAGLFGKARLFRRVMRRADVPASQTICIGDEQRDIEAARAAGAAAGAVLWGYASPDLLVRCGPTLAFERPADIALRLLPQGAAA